MSASPFTSADPGTGVTLPFVEGKQWDGGGKLPSEDPYLPSTRATDDSAPPADHSKRDEDPASTVTHDSHHSDNAAVIAGKHYDDTVKRYQSQLDQMQKYLASLDQQQQPPQYQQPMSYEAFNARYNQQDQKQLRNQTLSYLAIAIPLAAVFGAFSRGGVWGALGALGQGMTSLVKGHEDKANEDFKRYQEYAKQTEDMNTHMLDQYKAIMGDKHWTFNQKMRIMENLANYYGDDRLQQELGMYGVLGNLNNKSSLLRRHNQISGGLYRSLQQKQAQSGTLKPDGTKPTALETEWRDYVLGKGDPDPFSSSEAFNAALSKYPITSFKKGDETGKTEKKTGKENIFGRELDASEKAYQRYFILNKGFDPFTNDDNAKRAQSILPFNKFDPKDPKDDKGVGINERNETKPSQSSVYSDTQ